MINPKTIDFGIDSFLKMKNYYDLFVEDKVESKKIYIEFLKRFHPDKNNNSVKANEATVLVQALYNEYLKAIENGCFEGKGLIKLKSTDKKTYSMKYGYKGEDEISKFYVGESSILYIMNKENNDFKENHLNKINSVKYANDDMKKEFEKYIKKPLASFETKDKVCLIIEKDKDTYSIRQIINYYGGSIPVRHVAWVMSSMYNLSCFLHYNEIVNCGFTIDNYFLSPEKHNGTIQTFFYSTKEYRKMLGLPSSIYKILPTSIKEDKIAKSILDLESIRLLGRQMLGDENGYNLINNTDIPDALRDWLRGISSDDPFEEYSNWNKVLDKSFGKRKFIEMKIDKNKILGGC